MAQKSDLSEIKSVVCDNTVWDVLEPPIDANLLASKWVRTVKNNGDYKSRQVGGGFNMIHGVDYNETFSPAAKMVTIRIFLTLVAIYSLFTGALDVKTAFLNAPLQEDVWKEPPYLLDNSPGVVPCLSMMSVQLRLRSFVDSLLLNRLPLVVHLLIMLIILSLMLDTQWWTLLEMTL